MNVELYFVMTLLFFVTVNALIKAENYVERCVSGSTDMTYVALNKFCSYYEKMDRESNEYYCFFKKSAFDFD